uniref:Uncharacterized protein n=1 Tax=Siphoviridae sp. ctWhx86 TaxID=2826362 RepID=A0A8S5QP57_9CAUD|nr:MAG TPA: hypothetical protein [Siphoviridae sp. ctWhx86]
MTNSHRNEPLIVAQVYVNNEFNLTAGASALAMLEANSKKA